MSDFFEEPAAMQEMDLSAAHNLVIEALAELNAAEGKNEETVRINRSVGEKFLKLRELLGRARYLSWTAKRAKISERRVQKIIQVAEMPDGLPVEEYLEVLWGHPVKPKQGGSGRGVSSPSPTAFSRPKFIGGLNRVKTHAKAYVEEHNLGEPPAYQKICKAAETIEAEFTKLESKADDK